MILDFSFVKKVFYVTPGIPGSIVQKTPTFYLVEFFTSFYCTDGSLVRFCEVLL
jgi:hypothetical protein